MAEPTDPDLDDLLDEALDDFETEIRSSIATNPRPAPTNLPEALQNVRLADGSSPKPSEIPSTEQKFADSMKNILSSDEFAKKVLEDVDDPNMSSLLEEFSKTLQAAASEKKEGSDAPSNPEEEDEIQKNISKTLEHLSENVKKLEDAKDSDEMLDKLLDEFAADGEMGGMMESMMKQLMSKDILYEPLKEMAEKYPEWLAANKAKISVEDYERYTKQYGILQQIVKLYDADGDAAFQTVLNLMQEMQESGQPPAEIVSELAPGVSFGSDGLPILPGLNGEDGKSCSIM